MSGSSPVPQLGIFALGTISHAYLELDLVPGAEERKLASTLADLREPRTTIGGVNLVIGLRPELWRSLQADDIPDQLTGFQRPVVGDDGFTMPATQHDAVLWLSGSAYDVVFDTSREAIGALAEIATVADEVSSWPYRHDRDLTGFIDGTENPSLAEAPEVALVAEGDPGAGGSVLLLQHWSHDVGAWEALSREQQEQVIGRTKDDSTEFEDKADTSHVARSDQDEFGHVFRRNMPYGTVTDHGTMFVGFASSQAPLQRMLESMAGIGGPRDALTRYTTPLTGAYYFVPALSSIRGFASDPEAG